MYTENKIHDVAQFRSSENVVICKEPPFSVCYWWQVAKIMLTTENITFATKVTLCSWFVLASRNDDVYFKLERAR